MPAQRGRRLLGPRLPGYKSRRYTLFLECLPVMTSSSLGPSQWRGLPTWLSGTPRMGWGH